MELPDFHIPHAEKIEWMIETHGWAMEPVGPRTDLDPPLAGYVYTIGFPEAFEFPEVVLFGLTPAAARGLFDLIADLLRGGTDIPLGIELTGLFDNELRCVFAPIADELVVRLLATAVAWRRGAPFAAAQLLWPDRNGFLPTEAGFDRRLVVAQPVLGHVE
ncbi:MAG TPA: DUF4262 domain-containing protein [Ilumatobacteraceae bacterium]|nr:DUF4262 domain-containing protein [Ilumatobacteraceae bacterium]